MLQFSPVFVPTTRNGLNKITWSPIVAHRSHYCSSHGNSLLRISLLHASLNCSAIPSEATQCDRAYWYKCDIARRQPVCYIWRGICSSWRIPQTRGAMRHITRGSAMPYSAQKYVLGRETEKSMHRGIIQKIYFYIVQMQIIHSHIHAQSLMICHKNATN